MRSIRVRKDLSSAVVFFILSSILCSQVSGSGNEVKPAADSWEDYCPHTICQGVDEGRFIDNPFSCASYFRCTHGRAHDGACTEGTWFNYATQRCDVPWNVPCDAGQSIVVELECVTQEEPHYVISCRGNDELHTVPHPFDCNHYYLCISGLPIPRRCAPNLEFNAEESQCMEPEDAHCLLAECPPYNLPLTFLPSNRSCSEFSICYYGEAVPQYCADGLHWDQENEWCTHPNNTKCVVCNQHLRVLNLCLTHVFPF